MEHPYWFKAGFFAQNVRDLNHARWKNNLRQTADKVSWSSLCEASLSHQSDYSLLGEPETKFRLVAKKYKQESIPVGWVPPAFVVRRGGGLYIYIHPGYPTSWIPYPLDILPSIPYPLDTLPPVTLLSWRKMGPEIPYPLERTWDQRYPTPPWIEWQMPAKTFPSRNFVGRR